MKTLLACLLFLVSCSQSGVISTGFENKISTKTVYITSYIEDRPYAIGSGAIISPTGHILTAAHVVTEVDSIGVRLYKDSYEYDAKILKVDVFTDLALIKIKIHKPLSYFTVMDTTYVGDQTYVVGHPWGLEWLVTCGVVTGLIDDMMLVDAAINPGNSGGPVVNSWGSLIGITSAIISTTDAFSGIGVVVPGYVIVDFMNDFVAIEKAL